MLTKRCNSCELDKNLDEFWVSRVGRTRDGYMNRCKTCSKLLRKNWAAKNPDKTRTYNTTNYQINGQVYYERYFDQHKIHNANRRARKLDQFVEHVDPKVVYQRDNGICQLCDIEVQEYELDHIVPLSKGGEHSYKNIQLSHPKCNRVKSDSFVN